MKTNIKKPPPWFIFLRKASAYWPANRNSWAHQCNREAFQDLGNALQTETHSLEQKKNFAGNCPLRRLLWALPTTSFGSGRIRRTHCKQHNGWKCTNIAWRRKLAVSPEDSGGNSFIFKTECWKRCADSGLYFYMNTSHNVFFLNSDGSLCRLPF